MEHEPFQAPQDRPYVIINVAQTVDGKTDTVHRHGTSISSAPDIERVDRLRAAADAVLVGGLTLHGDDPRLTVKSAVLRAERVARGASANPAKVAIVSRPELRSDARFLDDAPTRRILLTTERASPVQLAFLHERGVEVFVEGEARVDPRRALARLQALGLHRVLVEGGGTLNFELLRLRLVDELHVYIAPCVFGGADAPTAAAGAGLPADLAIQLRRTRVEVWEDGGLVLEYAVV